MRGNNDRYLLQMAAFTNELKGLKTKGISDKWNCNTDFYTEKKGGR